MFKKILIANRGEIACRIIRTLRRMGIKTVGVYSEADEDALHVAMADEAYFIGPSPVRESYLNSQAILSVAKKSGVEAIHPGYGFLSENALFAEAVEKAGLIFIGPSFDVMRAMGDKLEAKRLALLAGVSCLPGTEEPLKTLHEAEKIAHEMGFPLMVKAAAGGGGKGMRIVRDSAFLAEAIKGAMHEANSNFGDERIFLEKYIDSARHIEIQILGDHEGNIIHLGERECSLQRRHQKVIEEAPSSFVTPALRKEMGDEAIRLAKTVKYTSAGTVEFVVDPEGCFYFLEMNTRLQVEHPTTEMITGIDLVEEMVRIAAGEPLRFQQSDVKFMGHVIETRLYAEDSSRGFLPSTGRIRTYVPPLEKKGEVRLESGVREGDVMTPYYDPMIAKLIVYQPSRELACVTLLEALNHYYIRGIATNIYFLASLVNASFFRKGQFNTTTLDELYGEGFTPEIPKNPQIASGAAAVMYCRRNTLDQATLVVLIEDKAHALHILREGERWKVNEGEETLTIETQWNPGECFFIGTFNGQGLTLQLDFKGIRDHLFWNGYGALTSVVTPRVAELIALMPAKQHPDISRIIMAPMPGLVVEVPVKEGDSIKRGHPIVMMEAMKMENIIRAGCDGIIEKVYVKKGESVNLDQHLAKIR
ncbi:MAG: acetyl-CoA carboxylase biotin carboxylase subunit [Alphaproteobacteria bacterium]|nr:acetyl-CoA carboxylase biotin carboxylase subunit [Alphaproteobacteria bacterium]